MAGAEAVASSHASGRRARPPRGHSTKSNRNRGIWHKHASSRANLASSAERRRRNWRASSQQHIGFVLTEQYAPTTQDTRRDLATAPPSRGPRQSQLKRKALLVISIAHTTPTHSEIRALSLVVQHRQMTRGHFDFAGQERRFAVQTAPWCQKSALRVNSATMALRSSRQARRRACIERDCGFPHLTPGSRGEFQGGKNERGRVLGRHSWLRA